MSQPFDSDDDSQFLSLPPSTASRSDPGDSASVFQPTVASRAPVPLLVSRPQRSSQKRNARQALLSVSGVSYCPKYLILLLTFYY